MHVSGRLVITAFVASLILGCGPNVGKINANPRKFYEEKVSVRGRVSRRQVVDDQALLELADAHERRMLALVPATDAPAVGDWVKVKGVLVADRSVGGVVVYDVIVTDRAPRSRAKAWWRFW